MARRHGAQTLPEHPRYRIQHVAALVGQSAATLRAWERRHGVPRPHRAGNAYRLYSELDLNLLRRMVALLEQGCPPADAARAARAMTEAEPLLRDSEVVRATYAAAVDQLVAAAKALDPLKLEDVARGLLTLAPAHRLAAEVLVPAWARVATDAAAGDARSAIAADLLGRTVSGLVYDLGRLLDALPGAPVVVLVPATPIPTPDTPRAPRPSAHSAYPEVPTPAERLGAELAALRLAHHGYRPIVLRTPPTAAALDLACATWRPAALVFWLAGRDGDLAPPSRPATGAIEPPVVLRWPGPDPVPAAWVAVPTVPDAEGLVAWLAGQAAETAPKVP